MGRLEIHLILVVIFLAGAFAPGKERPVPVRSHMESAPQPQPDDFIRLMERLRRGSPGEYQKVRQLPRDEAMEFLRGRFLEKPGERATSGRSPDGEAAQAPARGKSANVEPLPPRQETFQRIDTLSVGEFSFDLCRRADGAFGLGEVRRGAVGIRRADFLMTWQIGGRWPRFQRRSARTVFLSNPPATLTISPERRRCAGASFSGFRLEFKAGEGPIVETSSWEMRGSTHGLSYFDGYRGWHAPPEWLPADAVPPTIPKLSPSLLHGTGFQFQHGAAGALVHFHTTPGDRLRNASRGKALEFETTFHGTTSVDRIVLTAAGASRIDLWSRAFEIVHADLRRALAIPDRPREIVLTWPPFDRGGFRAVAAECAPAAAREGFTAAAISVIWDNLEFHGGQKNMNVWDYTVCEGYGGEAGLRSAIEECRNRGLRIFAWAPAGHLAAASPVWREHPDWVLRNTAGEPTPNPSGLWQGDLASGFRVYFRDRLVGAIRRFGLDGLWMDSHLAYAQQVRPPDHGALLAGIYRDFIGAGARQLIMEGDASVLGSYGIGIGEEWQREWGRIPSPDLYYGSTLSAGAMEPGFYRRHFRRYVASGAAWALDWDFLYSRKLGGGEIDRARAEIRQVLRDYRRVKDLMVHRFVHEDGSGYTWTNDQDGSRVVWLLEDATLPDGRAGKAGEVYVMGGGS